MMEWMVQHVVEKYNFWIAMLIIIVSLTATIVKKNFLKKLIGLSIFQTAFFLWVVSLGDVGRNILTSWGLKTQTPPILWTEAAEKGYIYANPLPHVLMLTGIVVSAATTAVALAIVIRIYQKYGTIEEDEIIEKELEFERRGVL
ncbi:MAG TPA: cation:proton antiporter subunit C [Methanothrix sp.]|nr:cation:proton antiporter subunit C [Methanothrix sp.]HQE88039.1 cation:proton antiporter subunit C [Methanothrix sp.]HQI68321.1 cation:proton antiporter subunit C [Methanothrix sp.]HRS85400.1 cation:proton antiporter subunit C [Methanothrix sp.]HRT17395.1 cation:proton antiporter subunit C [Methanothrix sp.]